VRTGTRWLIAAGVAGLLTLIVTAWLGLARQPVAAPTRITVETSKAALVAQLGRETAQLKALGVKPLQFPPIVTFTINGQVWKCLPKTLGSVDFICQEQGG
jgi:hypothetical protein